jgi:hypothetical protein
VHPILAKLPLIRRPFYHRDVARQERARAILERDSAIAERDAAIADRNALRVEPPKPALEAERASGITEPTLLRWCVCCNNPVEAWLPFTRCEASKFIVKLGTIGSNVQRFYCPHCSSIDRERHLRLFLERLKIMESVRNGSILHMAPEFRLSVFIMSFDLANYVQGDLSPHSDSIQRIDLQQIPFPDETFDMVICNHMLEHVADTEVALREMHRVLKHGGRAICQTPYSPRLTKTFEDPLLQSPDDRLFFYGQEDHLRLFGSDIEQYFTDAGFVGRMVSHADILPDVNPELAGINEDEPFFDFIRG